MGVRNGVGVRMLGGKCSVACWFTCTGEYHNSRPWSVATELPSLDRPPGEKEREREGGGGGGGEVMF